MQILTRIFGQLIVPPRARLPTRMIIRRTIQKTKRRPARDSRTLRRSITHRARNERPVGHDNHTRTTHRQFFRTASDAQPTSRPWWDSTSSQGHSTSSRPSCGEPRADSNLLPTLTTRRRHCQSDKLTRVNKSRRQASPADPRRGPGCFEPTAHAGVGWHVTVRAARSTTHCKLRDWPASPGRTRTCCLR